MRAVDTLPALKRLYGYAAYRDGQASVIDQLLAGRDALAVMPTGSGKSLCYQMPALHMEGITLVISPLISLMSDQVQALRQMDIRAAYINSSLTPGQTAKAMENARGGLYKLIYVAPERLLTPNFLDFAQNADIAMVAVDEAHCVSQWGHDFRPSYLSIPEFLAALPRRPVVAAFTATATRQVRVDIARALGLHNHFELTTGFDRPNLYFEVAMTRNKLGYVRQYVAERADASGIIYCGSRKQTDEICEMLRGAGVAAVRYHAGLSDAERRQNQDDFLFDRASVVVATSAFGMGIDKSNVAYVLNYCIPLSIEEYYQEAGRAGRDGSPADCTLLFAPQDIFLCRFLIDKTMEETPPEERADQKRRAMNKLNAMIDYAKNEGCLRVYLMNYFGDMTAARCGNCGPCMGKTAVMPERERNRERVRNRDRVRGGVVPALVYAVDEGLFDALKACRLAIAKEMRVPAFVILTDVTLREMAARKPRSRDAMLDIPGIGDVKLKRYGDIFLKVINGYKG